MNDSLQLLGLQDAMEKVAVGMPFPRPDAYKEYNGQADEEREASDLKNWGRGNYSVLTPFLMNRYREEADKYFKTPFSTRPELKKKYAGRRFNIPLEDAYAVEEDFDTDWAAGDAKYKRKYGGNAKQKIIDHMFTHADDYGIKEPIQIGHTPTEEEREAYGAGNSAWRKYMLVTNPGLFTPIYWHTDGDIGKVHTAQDVTNASNDFVGNSLGYYLSQLNMVNLTDPSDPSWSTLAHEFGHMLGRWEMERQGVPWWKYHYYYKENPVDTYNLERDDSIRGGMMAAKALGIPAAEGRRAAESALYAYGRPFREAALKGETLRLKPSEYLLSRFVKFVDDVADWAAPNSDLGIFDAHKRNRDFASKMRGLQADIGNQVSEMIDRRYQG